MLMERELTINKFVCGRWFLSLIALLLMSVEMQAEDYNLWVGATQVTSDNSSDVLGDGKVSWNNSSNTLTLNGATVNGTIVSDNDLIVHLVGRNVIHNSDAAFQIGGRNDLSFTAVRGATLFTVARRAESNAVLVGCYDNFYSNATDGAFRFVANDNLEQIKFVRMQDGERIKPFEAYLKSDSQTDELGVTDKEITAIVAISNSQEAKANSYYDLQGRRIASGPKSIAKGIYIINGQKTVIR